jgi:hypothetical protein
MNLDGLRRRRNKCIEELAALPGWADGSLVQTRRVQAGRAKPFRYLSRSVQGRNRITYVAAGQMPACRAALTAGRRARALFAQVCELTIAILKAEGKGRIGGAP